MNADAMFSSAKQDWETPKALFDELDKEFHFTLDAAAVASNAKVPLYLGPDRERPELRDIDGEPWQDRLRVAYRSLPILPRIAWLNPPYGRDIGSFLASARRNVADGWTVVALMPARTDTAWFHDHVLHRADIRFVRGRVRFVGAAASAPFPSMIVIWRP